MTNLYQSCLKPFLFRHEPEKIHHKTLTALTWLARSPALCDLARELLKTPALPSTALGLNFKNPLGLAAGMDKNGVAVPAWEALGFGFCEIGGVTQFPQPGNPQPRLFRAPETGAIINRMGFNNLGADAILQNLNHSHTDRRAPVGINLGKSKRTELADAHLDFTYSFKKLWAYGDFFVINVSSPNTPGLRALQDKESLQTILQSLNEANQACARAENTGAKQKPLLVKIAPDLTPSAIDDVIELAMESKLAGIVATNTTISRPKATNSRSPTVYSETGGLSGKPLQAKSTEIIRHIAQQTEGKLTIIGVGGIDDSRSAWEKIAAGANLLQLYSGLVFKGPEIIASIIEGLTNQLEIHHFESLQDAVGSNRPFISPHL